MRKLSALALLLLAAAPLRAQGTPAAPAPGEEVVDRVVAVVGDTTLLLSDVQEEVERLRASGRPIPTDPQGQDAMIRQIVDTRVNDLIVVQAAHHAGIEVQDQEVTQATEQDMKEVQQRFGSEAAFRQALAQSGMTLEEYRQQRTDANRARMLSQRFMQKQMGTVVKPVVTDAEMQAYFDAQKGQLGARPATVSFQQVVVEPVASDSAKAAARRRAEQVANELRAGGDFEVLAKRYSDDPGTKERGGELGWFRQGQMVRAFEDVAFALRPGDVSGIVETPFGFHIIKLEKTRGAERQARHILIRPVISEADQAAARQRADSVAAAIRAGASPTALAERYNTPAEQRVADEVPVERLPPAYGPALQGAAAGSVVGPFELQGGPNGSTWAVIRVTGRKEAGEYTLDDVRDQVREGLQQQKVMAQLIAELRQKTYVRVNL
ncbi:MAG: peptidylprolyl isomerase [Gemmatimonadetes bacterium]|nr:peptidylprolyl isomerase [Gemmatimonadota bacterium]